MRAGEPNLKMEMHVRCPPLLARKGTPFRHKLSLRFLVAVLPLANVMQLPILPGRVQRWQVEFLIISLILR